MTITIGLSACLAGQEVRFDKSHKKSNFCMNELARHVSFKTYCPEVAIGLPVPRPTIRQIKYKNVITVSRPDKSGDVTKELAEYGQSVAKKIDDLSGFIFTAKSPSCGMERVKIYHYNDEDKAIGSEQTGIGMFAKQIMEVNPALPCEENGRLNDSAIRENFVLRVFAYNTWQEMMKDGFTKHKLIQFHTKYKYLLMSHSQNAYRELGRLLGTSEAEVDALAQEYIVLFMTALKTIASRKSHANTLNHIQGYFSKHLTKEQKAELTTQIADYRAGLIPLMAPLTLLKHYLMMYPDEYIANQKYLDPYPADLKLRYGY
ncbi:YbgA family protein [Psychrosphaera aestuarii]|uniref:YbgA family protein n=1 Tax=Psychrosphaera aestuarii TaxID=1266052 RepID=UPI001B326D67|nr:DUF1722 domain-containing protein [Psychrosphaera aestuarii]